MNEYNDIHLEKATVCADCKVPVKYSREIPDSYHYFGWKIPDGYRCNECGKDDFYADSKLKILDGYFVTKNYNMKKENKAIEVENTKSIVTNYGRRDILHSTYQDVVDVLYNLEYLRHYKQNAYDE